MKVAEFCDWALHGLIFPEFKKIGNFIFIVLTIKIITVIEKFIKK